VPDLELQHRIRLALSWRMEAQRLEQEARTRYAAGTLEEGRFRHLQQRFADQAVAAQQALDAIRKREALTAGKLGAHLRDCLGRKAAIGQQIKEGTVSHATATAELERLEPEIQALRESVAEFNALLSAEDPVQVGGYMNAPLEQYPLRIAAMTSALATDAPTDEPVAATLFGRFRFTRAQLRLGGILLGFVLVAAIAANFMLNRNQAISLEAAWSPERPVEIAVTVANRGTQEYPIYIPTPKSGAMRQQNTSGIEVLRSDPQGVLQPFDTTGGWTIEGRATEYSNPQRLSVGTRNLVVLHLDRLPAPLGTGQHVLEIRCVGPTGRVLHRKQLTVTAPS